MLKLSTWGLVALLTGATTVHTRCGDVVVNPPTSSPSAGASASPASSPSPAPSITPEPSPSVAPSVAPSVEPSAPPTPEPPTPSPTVAPPSPVPSVSPSPVESGDFPACGGIPDYPVPSIYREPCPPGTTKRRDNRDSATRGRPEDQPTGLFICTAPPSCGHPTDAEEKWCPDPTPEDPEHRCIDVSWGLWYGMADNNRTDGRPGLHAVLGPGLDYGYAINAEGHRLDAYGREYVSAGDLRPLHDWTWFGWCPPRAARPCPSPTPVPTPTPLPTPQPSVTPSTPPSSGEPLAVTLHVCRPDYPRPPEYVHVQGWRPAPANPNAHLVDLKPMMHGPKYCANENGGTRLYPGGGFAGWCEMWAPCTLQGLAAEDAPNANPPQPIVKATDGTVLNTWKPAVRAWGPGGFENGDKVEFRSRLCEPEDAGFVPPDWIGKANCLHYYMANLVIGDEGSPHGHYTVCAAPRESDIKGPHDVVNGDCQDFDW